MNKINNIFKPKSKEEILHILSNYKINSYNLESFFKLIPNKEEEIKMLKSICKKLDISPNDMEVSMVNDFLRKLLNNYFDKASWKDPGEIIRINSGPFKNPWNDELQYTKPYFYSIKYKLIKFDAHSPSMYSYFAFPKKDITKIILQLLDY